MMARRPPAPHRRIRAARPWVEHVDPWARSHRSELMWRLARLLVGLVVGLLAGLVASAASLAAQDAPPVELAVRDDGSLAVEVGDLFSDGRLRQALHEGLPLRLRMEATLWRDGLFDQQVQSERWQASLFFDPVMQRYIMRIGDREPIQASRLDEATQALRSALEFTLKPVDRGRYYYLATFEVETLSLSDLEELERWLRGELPSSIEEGGGLDGAITRGLGRILVRALGLPTRRIQLRSTAFDVDP